MTTQRPPGSGTTSAFFIAELNVGGTERITINLANELCLRGHAVDLVVFLPGRQFAAELAPGIRVIALDRPRAAACLLPLIGYLRRVRPRVLFTTGATLNIVAIAASLLARTATRIVPTEHMPVGIDRRENPDALLRFAYRLYPLFYRFVKTVVVISHEAAADFRREFPGLAGKVRVISNPVVSPDIARRALERPASGPLASLERAHPVLIGAGRLTRQKNFELLLRAFALVLERRACELVILGGRGESGVALERLAAELGVAAHVHWAGVVANPYAYFSRASLFVLSSIYETLPTVLIEAMACGTAAVTTPCGGVGEILEHGTYGTIVADFEPPTLAEAILSALDRPLPAEFVQGRAAVYSIERSADRYAALIEDATA